MIMKGVALAMRHSGLSTYGLKGQCVGDEHPAYASGDGPLYPSGLQLFRCVTMGPLLLL